MAQGKVCFRQRTWEGFRSWKGTEMRVRVIPVPKLRPGSWSLGLGCPPMPSTEAKIHARSSRREVGMERK